MTHADDFESYVDRIIRNNADLPPAVIKKLEEFRKQQGLGADGKEVQKSTALATEKEFLALCQVFPERSRNRALALIGLRLRKDQKNQKKVERLLNIVRSGFEGSGRRAAQAVQCGAVTVLLEELEARGHSLARRVQLANRFLDEIDRHAHFVQDMEAAPVVAVQVRSRLTTGAIPAFYLVAGSGSAAKTAREAAEAVNNQVSEWFHLIPYQNDRSSYVGLFLRV